MTSSACPSTNLPPKPSFRCNWSETWHKVCSVWVASRQQQPPPSMYAYIAQHGMLGPFIHMQAVNVSLFSLQCTCLNVSTKQRMLHKSIQLVAVAFRQPLAAWPVVELDTNTAICHSLSVVNEAVSVWEQFCPAFATFESDGNVSENSTN